MQNFAKIGQSTTELWSKALFSNMASVHHLEFKILKFGHNFVLIYFCIQNFIKICWYFLLKCVDIKIQCTNFHYNRIIFSLRYADLTIFFSGHPPSWICDDVIILHPVIDLHDVNIVLNVHVDWFNWEFSYKSHICAKQTDRRTNRQRRWTRPIRFIPSLIGILLNVNQIEEIFANSKRSLHRSTVGL